MAIVGYRFEVECAGAGGSVNPAVVTNFADVSGSTHERNLAHMIAAITGYASCAANCSIARGWWFPITPGGGATPIDWPGPAYDALVAEFPAEIPALTGYGDTFGAGDLTVLGAGIVIQKSTATAGRSHRGRLTTPWLAKTAVDNAGSLANAGIAPIQAGWQELLTGPRVPTYLFSRTLDNTQLINQYVVRDRLGRQSRRTR